MIGVGSPDVAVLPTHDAVVGMDFMHVNMIADGSPAVVGLSTHCTVGLNKCTHDKRCEPWSWLNTHQIDKWMIMAVFIQNFHEQGPGCGHVGIVCRRRLLIFKD